MQAGQLRNQITIQSKTETTDSYGGTVSAWSDFATVMAKIRPLRGRELVAAQAVQSEAEVMFYLRYLSGVESSMRIAHESTYYDIVSIVDVDFRHKELEISTKTGLSEG